MEPVNEAASAPVEDEDARLFSEAFNAVETKPVVRGEVEVKQLADTKTTDKETFAQAWKHNRDAGNKTFEWAGKPGMKYSTENKAEALARKAVKPVVTKPVSAKPVIVAKSVNQAKPTPQQIEEKVKPVKPEIIREGPNKNTSLAEDWVDSLGTGFKRLAKTAANPGK